MHFSRLAVTAACFASFGQLVLADDPIADTIEEAAESSAAASIALPRFTPTILKAPFLEQFTDDWETRWSVSNAKKAKDKPEDEEEWQFIGTWAVEEPTVLKGMEGDKGLVLKDKAAHHAISAKFPTKIDNKGKTLVVQYEVKLQDGLECGGAYMKLLRDTEALQTEEFSNASPYVIMFGPDRCGSTNKVHFIFQHKNPITGEYEEKHLTPAPNMLNEKTSTLYTLIINPDQTFEISVNGESQKTGSFFEDFKPSVNPEKEIDDPEDEKPSTWVDDARIEDPAATKPEDWDEDAPFQIVDESAEKPDDWLEDELTMIPDPEAVKPEDWDDEEDGDWIAPTVPNPKCAEASGCGPWEKPMIKNPDYKGPWKAPMIDNPDYKGVWAPRKIANPSYFEDKTPADLEPIGAIGFELWTMSKDILFDNIYIGHSIEEANQFKAETFDIKKPVEVEIMNAAKPKNPDGPADIGLSFTKDPVFYLQTKFKLFIAMVQTDPVRAIKEVPEIAGGLATILVTLIAVVVGGIGAGSSSPQVQQAAKKAKEVAVNAKDKASEAAATGAEKVQSEVNKRTTRSNN